MDALGLDFYHLRENLQKSRRWDGDNAEAMMALACLDDRRMWRTYWTKLDPARN